MGQMGTSDSGITLKLMMGNLMSISTCLSNPKDKFTLSQFQENLLARTGFKLVKNSGWSKMHLGPFTSSILKITSEKSYKNSTREGLLTWLSHH